MIRMILFMCTNLSVMSVFGTVLFLAGIDGNSISGLMILSGLVGFGGSIISLLLSKWTALKSFHGMILNKPNNPMELWILSTVHKQSYQVGITPPTILIYYKQAVNAFATGCYKHSALLALSTGLLQVMNRDEIEAVIAHEISHIANGDMVTLSLIHGVTNTFVFFISRILSETITNFISDNKKSIYIQYCTTYIHFVIATILQTIFGGLASMIVMWFSRYREFRADAGAAQLVGSEKIINALKKFHSISEPKYNIGMNAHYIHGKSGSSLHLFASHPPIQTRIHAIYKKTYM
ncbi:protease HtpX [Buchnera aphidicola]|uniref:Protease HtpX n=1 Tax=Buchnera aphidicola (Stegophylla sp.) TaxID=2315800 RepID=A0A4D6YAB3_9GAMM|nr:protease HtpX [Buchnera aphidicola (Stegophylla sp.)]QCI26379.1 protease HtpX [Buchnera aphidicola (Stegophylla sp.)]